MKSSEQQHAELVRELLSHGPTTSDRDGWYWCFYCGGDGDWDPMKIGHEDGCVWVRATALIDGDDRAEA